MASRKLVAVLDDDASVLGAVERVLKAHGFDAQVFDTVEGFLGGARLGDASCLVLDINLNGMSGIDLQPPIDAFRSVAPGDLYERFGLRSLSRGGAGSRVRCLSA